MTPFWIAQLLNVAILIAFGAFLMWRSRCAFRQRMAHLAPIEPDAVKREQRVAFLRAEIARLREELAELERQPVLPEASTVA